MIICKAYEAKLFRGKGDIKEGPGLPVVDSNTKKAHEIMATKIFHLKQTT